MYFLALETYSAADRDPQKNDTSTGGTTFSNLYKIDQWSM